MGEGLLSALRLERPDPAEGLERNARDMDRIRQEANSVRGRVNHLRQRRHNNFGSPFPGGG